MKVKFKKLVPDAVIPSYAKPGDAGLDLTATEVDFKDGLVIYKFGLAVEIPDGYVGLLFPRSSIKNYSLQLTNCVGVIDSGYRGELQAMFSKYERANVKDRLYVPGDRVLQMIIMAAPKIEIEEAQELSSTERGAGGFGSSGK